MIMKRVLGVVCLAWVVWPTPKPVPNNDVDEAQFRVPQTVAPLVSRAEASPKPAARVILGVPQITSERKQPPARATTGGVLLGHIVEPTEGADDGNRRPGVH